MLIRSSIKQVYEESNQIYGSYKIADQLGKDDRLEAACRNTVASAMREMGLKSRVSKKFTPITTVSDPSKVPAPNILDQIFTADAPNQKWVTDITYLPTESGWVYLASRTGPLQPKSRRLVDLRKPRHTTGQHHAP